MFLHGLVEVGVQDILQETEPIVGSQARTNISLMLVKNLQIINSVVEATSKP